MPVKCLQIQVELEIQAVTCPGVWLCPSGKLSIEWYMLNSHIRTASMYPLFPMLCHEKYNFYKTFYDVHTLGQLQNALDQETVYVELIQWKNCNDGFVLATFQAYLSEVLYPNQEKSLLAGVDIDLLMESTKTFPGIIAPKIEIAITTTIEEVRAPLSANESGAYIVNPRTVSTNYCPCMNTKGNTRMQKKVCHSLEYHMNGKCLKDQVHKNKPPFVIRKCPEDLIGRKLGHSLENKKEVCAHGNAFDSADSLQDRRIRSKEYYTDFAAPHKTYVEMTDKFLKRYPNIKQPSDTHQGKIDNHSKDYCVVCNKYTHSFHTKPISVCDDPPSPKLSPNHKDQNFSPERSKQLYEYLSDEEHEEKPSLASKLHNKLTKVLSCRPTYPFVKEYDGTKEYVWQSAKKLSIKCPDCMTVQDEFICPAVHSNDKLTRSNNRICSRRVSTATPTPKCGEDLASDMSKLYIANLHKC